MSIELSMSTRPYSGKLIVVEGVNGSGKSSIIEVVQINLNRYTPVKVYKFPNRDTETGQIIDKYLKKEIHIDSKYDVLDLFARNKLESRTAILEDLYSGVTVICDRYIYSAIAYHIPLGTSRQHTVESYSRVIGYFDYRMPAPDLTILINGSHLDKRNEIEERFHYLGDDEHLLYKKLYQVINVCSDNWIVIDNMEGMIFKSVTQVIDAICMLDNV